MSEENKLWLLSSELGSTGGIKVVNERNFLFRVRKFNVSLVVKSIIGVSTEESNSEFVGGNLLFEGIAGNLSRWWSCLLENPRNDSIGSSSTLVVGMFSVFEPFEGWESLDTEFLSEFLLLSGVNLSKEEWWVIFGESFSSLFIFWSKLFAVSTPWGIEFNKKIFVLLDFLVEVVVGKDENSIIGFDSRDNAESKKCN